MAKLSDCVGAMQVQLLESFMAHSSDGIVVVDLEGKVLEVNRAFETMHGWTKEEAVGAVLPMTPAHLLEEDKLLHAQVLAGKHVTGYETYKLKKDGTMFPASVSISPITDEAGGVIAFVNMERDIAAQKTAEDSLHETEKLYECLVENALAGVYLFQDGKMVYVNPYLSALFGHSREEAMQSRPETFIHPDDAAAFRGIVAQTMEGRASAQPFSVRGVKKDGSVVHMEGLLTLTRYKGKPALLGTFQDVTYKNEVEETLRENEQRYQRLIKFLPEPIVVSDEGVMLYANKSAMKLFRASGESELIGKSLFSFVHPEHRQEAMRIERNVMNTDNPSPFTEIRMICCDGQTIEAELSSIRIHHYMGKTVMLTVLRDITDRKQAEEMMIRSEKLSIIGQLAAGLAHEIRNPLTSLKGFTQLLKSKSKDDSFYFDTMLTELERINLIVGDFMTLAKPQLSQFGYRNVYGMLEHVISVLNHQAILLNVNLVSRVSRALPDIYCDENQLKQVFINLIKNAMEAMPRGGNVFITAEHASPDTVCIKIKDQGEGIPESIVHKLGEPFLTTKTNGTGLGLMISYRIMEHHHGTMKICSRKKQGTTVKLLLPVPNDQAGREEAAQTS